MRTRETGAFQDILAALAADSVILIRKQYDLLRLETGMAARRVVSAVMLGLVGATAAVVATVFLGIALFEWLAVLLASRPLAALAAAGAAAFTAVCLLAIAYRLFIRTSFLPRRTFASIRGAVRGFAEEARDE